MAETTAVPIQTDLFGLTVRMGVKPPSHKVNQHKWNGIRKLIEMVGYDEWVEIRMGSKKDAQNAATSANGFVRRHVTSFRVETRVHESEDGALLYIRKVRGNGKG